MIPARLAATSALAAIALGALALGACEPGVPDAPSFQTDIMPILAASCVRCHGGPPIGGAPPSPRLDSYADLADHDLVDPFVELPIGGAATAADRIAARVRNSDSPMPPRFPLDDWQADVLARWAELGAPRGAPRPGNRPPQIEILRIAPAGAGQALRVRVSDPDGDLVAGTLRAITINGAFRPLVGAVRSGELELVWQDANLAEGVYPLVAFLDDGAEVHEVPAGQIEVLP
jgi:hypothetical protein